MKVWFQRTASALALLVSGCAANAVMGLPMPEFNRVFLAGIDVAGAEHCGRPVNAGLVRTNLLAYQTKRGLPVDQIEQTGKVFDKNRAEFRQRISTQADFCAKEYKPDPARIALYEKGEFPDVK
jgi:hypothetical protein